MATRAYVRGSGGKFAGAKSGGKVTYGKAGGFANAAFRARVQQSRAASAGAARPKTTGKTAAQRKSGLTKGQAQRRRSKLALGIAEGAIGAGLIAAASRKDTSFGNTLILGTAGASALVNGVSGVAGAARPSNPAGRKVKKASIVR